MTFLLHQGKYFLSHQVKLISFHSKKPNKESKLKQEFLTSKQVRRHIEKGKTQIYGGLAINFADIVLCHVNHMFLTISIHPFFFIFFCFSSRHYFSPYYYTSSNPSPPFWLPFSTLFPHLTGTLPPTLHPFFFCPSYFL